MPNSAHGVLWIGFEGLDAHDVKPGFVPGGIVLFARNLDSDITRGPARCHAMIRELQQRWGGDRTLAVAIDQEGGTVSRLKTWTGATPSFHRIWTIGGVEACLRWGKLWGRGLRLLGINVDFAPAADLYDGHEGTGIGERAASGDPLEVAQAVGAFLSGMESMGVRGCLKHFPGLGGTRVDSHKAMPELQDEAQIERNLQPFRALAHEDRLLMVGHLKTPFTEGLPASLHRGTVAANPWGIRGRWITDDMEMGGCSDWSWDEKARLCLEAGHQALLVCQTSQGVQACARAMDNLPESLWRPALEQFNGLRANLTPASDQAFDGAEWATWLEELREEVRRF